MRHGWFAIPGVQTGDRTLAEQMLGVKEALDEARDKTVLDLGCAEGLISREFARAGATVMAIDAIGDHVKVAMGQCEGYDVGFDVVGLDELAAKHEQLNAYHVYDIVLALGVCHKLHDPATGVRFAARSSDDLVLIRMHARSEAKDGLLRSKFKKTVVCNTVEIMESEGFKREKILPGPREETVWWWRRNG